MLTAVCRGIDNLLSRRRGTAVLVVVLALLVIVVPLVLGLKLALLVWILLAVGKAYGMAKRDAAPPVAGKTPPRQQYIAQGTGGLAFILSGDILTLSTGGGHLPFDWGVAGYSIESPTYTIPVSAVTTLAREIGTGPVAGRVGVVIAYQIWNGDQLIAAGRPLKVWLHPGPQLQAGDAFIAALSAATGLTCQMA